MPHSLCISFLCVCFLSVRPSFLPACLPACLPAITMSSWSMVQSRQFPYQLISAHVIRTEKHESFRVTWSNKFNKETKNKKRARRQKLDRNHRSLVVINNFILSRRPSVIVITHLQISSYHWIYRYLRHNVNHQLSDATSYRSDEFVCGQHLELQLEVR